jgi:hypothetical protein
MVGASPYRVVSSECPLVTLGFVSGGRSCLADAEDPMCAGLGLPRRFEPASTPPVNHAAGSLDACFLGWPLP